MKNNSLIPFKKELASKAGREQIAKTLVDKVVEGELDPINTLIEARRWAELFKLMEGDEKFIEAVRNAVGPTGTELYGTKVEQTEAGVKYHFENCNDPEWTKLKAEADRATEALKEREKVLKTFPRKGVSVIDEETGEIVTIYPPYKESKSTYKVTLNK